MLEPKPFFTTMQFVQEIAFKNKDIHRHDLGIERFGFILSSHIVARTHCEYQIQFAGEVNQNSCFEYSLRPLKEKEIEKCLAFIKLHQDQYIPFIIDLNGRPELQSYHITEDPCVIEYRQKLTFQTA